MSILFNVIGWAATAIAALYWIVRAMLWKLEQM